MIPMYFLTEDGKLLAKYNTIWEKFNADIKNEFDSNPVYNNIFLKTKYNHVTKFQIFFHKKFLRQTLIILD